MKKLILGFCAVLPAAVAFACVSAPARAGEGKATVCYEESYKYASGLAADKHAKLQDGKLEMFTNIGDVQTEGWSFPVSTGGLIIVVASADGSGGEQCRVNLLYSK